MNYETDDGVQAQKKCSILYAKKGHSILRSINSALKKAMMNKNLI